MADIKIDGKLFQERVTHFVNAWKADKRASDNVFAGASSIIILMGKVEETPEFHKNNAMHVRCCHRASPLPCPFRPPPCDKHILMVLQFWLLGYEFPNTLMMFTTETLYIITTQKKGKDMAENEKKKTRTKEGLREK